MKLYRSTKDICWFAFGPAIGWVMFPAEIGGWQKRHRATDIDPVDMQEVPLRMGFNTGIPGAPVSSGLFFAPKRTSNLRPPPAMRRHDNQKAAMKTFLVLEYETVLMKLIGHLPKQYCLIKATTAEQALWQFCRHGRQVDLLFADVTLPKSTGIQVALLLRSVLPDLPVILTSGGWSVQDNADLERLGLRSVTILQKPLQTHELSNAVCELLGTPRNVAARIA